MKLNPFSKTSPEREAFKARTNATDEQIDHSDDVYLLVAIYDIKAQEIITQPVPYKNSDVALREFTKLINHPQGMFNSNPHDFIMKRLAHINIKTGQIWENPPENMFSGTDVLGAQNGRPQ